MNRITKEYFIAECNDIIERYNAIVAHEQTEAYEEYASENPIASSDWEISQRNELKEELYILFEPIGMKTPNLDQIKEFMDYAVKHKF